MLKQAGVEDNDIFCTSLPENGIHGNDYPKEIVQALEKSVYNIILFSSDYTSSVHCMNEAGIIWFQYLSKKSVPMFCLADTHFNIADMKGFVNGRIYNIHRLSKREIKKSVQDLCKDVRKVMKIKKNYTLVIDYLDYKAENSSKK